MFSLLMVCMGVVSYLAILSIHSLFGVEKPEDVVSGIFIGPNDRLAFFFVQAVSSLGGFGLAAILFAALESGNPLGHLGLRAKASFKFFVVAFIAIIAAQFFIEFLVDVNSRIPIPAGLASLDERQKEVEKLTAALLNFTDVGNLLVAAFVMAVVPAVVEELFFRGLLLGDLLKQGVHPAISIVVSGLFFAVFHFEFNNTLAITVLGCFLGYLYYATGSLWVPIAAHFTNNFFAVLLKYLFNTGVIGTDLAEASTPLYLTVASLAVFAGCVYLFYSWRKPNAFVVTPYYNDIQSQSEQE